MRALLLAAALAAATASSALAQGKGGKSAPSQSKEQLERMGQVTVGLVPVYPAGATCPPIASPFGSETRFDSSLRANPFYGFHSGMDISAAPGTPLLAVAAGEVVHKGNGGLLVGNYVWLRHTPEDTGLPVWLYTRYQHLDRPAGHELGARLKLGDYVAPAGKTGTQGPAFGPAGYSHLHLLVFAADGPAYKTSEAIVTEAPGRRYLDPLAIYLKPTMTFDNHALQTLADADKRVAIPYQLADGTRMPAATKLVWPLACAKG